MALHAYKARDEEGQLRRGELDVSDQTELRELLGRQGLYLVETRAGASPTRCGGSVSRDELILFAFHLQAVMASGVPLLLGLNDLEEQTRSRGFRAVVRDVRESIQKGSTLAQALGRHPKAFPLTVVRMVEAGEASGRLDEILGRLVHLLEWSAELRAQVRQLLTYPAIVCTAMLGLVVLMLTYVLPKFTEILESLNTALPLPTRILLGISSGFRHYWLLIAGAGLALGALAVFLFRLPSTRERLDALALRVPVVGRLHHALAGSQIAHFLGAFSEAGVPIAQALLLLSGLVSNRHVSRGIVRVHDRVLGGQTLTQAFGETAILPPLVFRMLAIGEETGAMSRALRKAEEFYDRDIPRRVKKLMDLTGPVLTVFLGATLLFVLASVLLPLYRAYSAISGGAG